MKKGVGALSLQDVYQISPQKSRDIRAKILNDSREIRKIAKTSKDDAIIALKKRGVIISYDEKTGEKSVSVVILNSSSRKK